MPRFESPSNWTPSLVQQHIDPVLYQDRQIEISHEMQTRSFSVRNSARNDLAWAKAELQVCDEWVEKLLQAWIETWDIQGFPRCQALYRAFFDFSVRPLLSTRATVFKSALAQQYPNELGHHTFALGGWFQREINRLSSKWNRKMDVDFRKGVYTAKQESADLARAWNSVAQPSAEPSNPLDKVPKTSISRKGGRKPVRAPEFVDFAGNLWKMNQSSSRRVTQEALKCISAALDESPFRNPSKFLEAKSATALKDHNKKFGHSPKKLMSWTDIAVSNHPELKSAMRKLLSRCARTSGN